MAPTTDVEAILASLTLDEKVNHFLMPNILFS